MVRCVRHQCSSLHRYLICGGFFHEAFSDEPFQRIEINLSKLLLADFASAAVLITFGALLGKVTPLQLLAIGFLEIIIFSVNEK